MKTNELLLLIIFLAGWNLASLSCFAQVNVDESQLIGNWCYESTQTVAVKDGIVGVINSKLIYTYQTNGIVMCQVNINNDVFIDMAGYKNNLKIEFSKTFQGKWSIKKGHILVQKINDPNSSSMNMVIDHEDSFYDKIYLPDIKTIMREALPKQAEAMLKTHKENILSLSETEMVTDKGYYKHSLESASVEGFEGLSAEELMQKGWECSQRGDQEMSFKYFEKAAQQGNSEAQFWTGVNYEMGDGVKENHKKAFFGTPNPQIKGILTEKTHLVVVIAMEMGYGKTIQRPSIGLKRQLIKDILQHNEIWLIATKKGWVYKKIRKRQPTGESCMKKIRTNS